MPNHVENGSDLAQKDLTNLFSFGTAMFAVAVGAIVGSEELSERIRTTDFDKR